MRVASSVIVLGAVSALGLGSACGTTTFAVSQDDSGPGDAARADTSQPRKDASGAADTGHDAIADAKSPGTDAGIADVGAGGGKDAAVDAANDGCAFFCDNFDEYAGTTLPAATWTPGADASAPMVVSTAEAKSGTKSALATVSLIADAPQTISAVHTTQLMGKASSGIAFDTDVYLDPGTAVGVTAKPTGIVLAVAIGETVYAIQAMGGASESYEVIEEVARTSLSVLGQLSITVPNAKWTHVRFLAAPGTLTVSVQPAGLGSSSVMYAAGNPTQFSPADLTSATATISIGLTSLTVMGSLKVYYDNVVIGLP